MPKSKIKSSKVSRDPVSENSPQFVSGTYDGDVKSTDFAVSGHSSGSQHSEMNELSQQVAMDALGTAPYKTGRFNDFGLKPGTFDTAGELYQQDVPGTQPSRARNIALWSAVTAVGAGLLGYIGYELYSRYQMRQAAVPVFPKKTTQARKTGKQRPKKSSKGDSAHARQS